MPQPSHREDLLKGAMKCLRTKGYARTTARDIAAASGANLASIGYHFGSKDALLNEALIKIFKRRNWKVGEEALEARDASPLARLRMLFADAGEVFKAPRPLFAAFVEAIAHAERSPELREQLAEFYRTARKGIAETVRSIAGDLDAEADVMGALIMALFDGLVLQWLLEPDVTPDGNELIDSLLATTRAVLTEGKEAVDG